MATPGEIGTLKHFKWSEFKRPDLCHFPFLQWLDDVRGKAGVSFVLTSDARTEIPPGGSPNSLHLKGRAVDFRWVDHTPEQRARIVEAATQVDTPDGEGGYELGLEPTAVGGAHWHLGLFPAGRASRVFVR